MEEKFPFEKIEREVVIRQKFLSNPDLGKSPENRSVDELLNCGVINLNKGKGPTSHMYVDYLKKVLNAKRVGHSGTLDPGVTGCLPTALNKGTRIAQVLLPAGKEYVCLMYLHDDVNQDKFDDVIKKFFGKIKQLPPVKSAVKRMVRDREIYYLTIMEKDKQNVLFRIGCQAGTYIRKICHDLGQELGCGAHMVQLIRTRVGMFNIENSYSLHDIKDAYEYYKNGDDKKLKEIVLPIEKAVEHLPKIWVFDSAVESLCQGSNLFVTGISKLNSNIKRHDLVVVMTLKNELVCIGEAEVDSEKLISKNKGLGVKTSKVFMERGIYKN